MQNKPTYDELQQALQAIVTDAFNTYQVCKDGKAPVISIGQFGRLNRAQELIGRIADADCTTSR